MKVMRNLMFGLIDVVLFMNVCINWFIFGIV